MLQTPILSIKKGDGITYDAGLVKADVAGLNMRAMDMNVKVSDNFGANDYARLRDMYFAGGHGFNLAFTGGDPTPKMAGVTLAGNLQVSGKDNYFNSPIYYNNANPGNSAYFQIEEFNRPGDVMLTALAEPIFVSNHTKILMGAGSPGAVQTLLSKFAPDDEIVLINHTAGDIKEGAITGSFGATDLYFHILNKTISADGTSTDDIKQIIAKCLDIDTGKGVINNLSNVSRLVLIENGQNEVINIAELLKAIDNPETTTFLNPGFFYDIVHPDCTISMRSAYGLAGIKHARPTSWGSFQFGAFFDAARGNYYSEDNYNGFQLRGDGKADTIGGGLFAGLLWKNGFGLDASFRAGRVRSDLATNSGSVGYDSSTWYVGGHFGISQTFDLTCKSSIRPYGRFLWAYEGEDNTVSRSAEGSSIFPMTGEDLHFDQVNSARFQIGARYSYNLAKNLTAYADAAFEYQPDGRIESLLNGIPVNRIKTNGHAVNLKLGGIWQQCPDTGRGWDARVEGGLSTDADNKISFSGSVMVGYGF